MPVCCIIFTPHNMPDPLALRRERKMHSKTYTKSPRVWKVCCCCFLPGTQPTPLPRAAQLFAGFYNMQCALHYTPANSSRSHHALLLQVPPRGSGRAGPASQSITLS